MLLSSHQSPSPSSPKLLSLPSELRNQIWNFAFSHLHITSFERWYLGPSPTTQEVSCDPCNSEWRPISSTALSYRSAFGPLLTCKQIYNEAIEQFLSTFILHLDTPHAVTGAATRHETRVAVNLLGNATSKHHSLNKVLRENVRRLCLYVHLDDFTRGSWCTALGHLRQSFPRLEKLDVHNHMRPPTSYDNLVDAIYIIGPLCTLGEPFGLNEEWRRSIDDDEDDDELSDTSSGNDEDENETNHDSNGMPSSSNSNGTIHSTSKINEISNTAEEEGLKPPPPQRNLHLHLSYPQPQTPMFHAAHLGAITTSDSLHEHSQVLRELFTDPAFVAAATHHRLSDMTGALLAVARRHEQPWFERLQRRRLIDMRMQMFGWDEDWDVERRRRRRGEVARLVRRELRAMQQQQQQEEDEQEEGQGQGQEQQQHHEHEVEVNGAVAGDANAPASVDGVAGIGNADGSGE